MAAIVDTNVAITANEAAPQAGPECVLAAVRALRDVRDTAGPVLVDADDRILMKYRRNLRSSGQPGVGDAFLLWLLQNQANPNCCEWVSITPKPEDPLDFEEFPDDPELHQFDRSDRKWVAVALASGRDPEIYNATDTDWWHHRVALERHGVRTRFLCPQLMAPPEDASPRRRIRKS